MIFIDMHLHETHSIIESGAQGRVIQMISNWPSDNFQPLRMSDGRFNWGDKYLCHAVAWWFTRSMCFSRLSEFGERTSSEHLPDVKRMYLRYRDY